MNYMPKVLEMLGVEVGEKFNIKNRQRSPYAFDRHYNLRCSGGDPVYQEMIVELLNGTYEIEKIPWKPKEHGYYFCVDGNGDISYDMWVGCMRDFYSYNCGNCFKFENEITDEIKQRILQEMKGKYEND